MANKTLHALHPASAPTLTLLQARVYNCSKASACAKCGHFYRKKVTENKAPFNIPTYVRIQYRKTIMMGLPHSLSQRRRPSTPLALRLIPSLRYMEHAFVVKSPSSWSTSTIARAPLTKIMCVCEWHIDGTNNMAKKFYIEVVLLQFPPSCCTFKKYYYCSIVIAFCTRELRLLQRWISAFINHHHRYRAICWGITILKYIATVLLGGFVIDQSKAAC